MWAASQERLAFPDHTAGVASILEPRRNRPDKESCANVSDGRTILASLADAFPGALYSVISAESGEFTFSFLSKGIKALYGFSADEVSEDPMLLNRCMHEVDIPGYKQASDFASENMSVLDHEYRITSRSGELRWIGVRAVPQSMVDGSTSWSGVMVDITDRKQAEDAQAATQTLFRTLFGVLPQGIILRDHLGTVVDANPAAAHILQTSLTELLNTPAMHPLVDAIWPDGSPVPNDELPSLVALRTGEPTESKIIGSARGRGGKNHIWMRVNAVPILRNKEIYRVIVTLEDLTDGVKLTRKLQEEAETDFLTQVSNRRSFMARLSAEVDRLQFDPEPSSAVLAIDLDHFKAVNDTFGHACGDAVLVHAASMMAESIRPADVVARSGGEEFAVLLTDTTPNGAIALAERLRAAIEEHPTFHDGREIRATASIGLTLIANADITAVDVLARADQAMYDAKRAGRNAVKADWL